MRIKTLDIYGYGKWVNQRFDLDRDMQLFYGHNEAGKSTLQSFIRSILFGFPNKRRRVNQQNRFEPRNGEVYGGRILLTDTAHGDIWIERTSKRLTVTTVEGEVLPNRALDEVLAGLDETLYDNFYAFTLQNLQELGNIDAEQLNDYFLSIGTIGSDKFLKIAKQYQKETDEMYRPQGQSRPLNQLLSEYDQLAQKVKEYERNAKKYDLYIEQLQEQDKLIVQLTQEINEYEQSLREQDKLIGRYDVYLKSRSVKRELEQLVQTDISSQMIEQLEEATKSTKHSHEKLIQLEERVRNLTGELGTLTKLNWANNHEDERQQWKVATQQAKEQQAMIESLIQRIKEQQEMMVQLAHRGQFFPEKVSQEPSYIEKMESGLAIQGRKHDIMQAQDALKAERKVYLEQRKEQQNHSAIMRQNIVKLETQRMNEEAQLASATSLNHYFIGIIFVVVGVVVAAVNYLTNEQATSLYLWLGAGIATLGAASILYVYNEHRRHYDWFKNSPVLEKIQELREKERLYQEQSQAIGMQINQREEQLDELAQQMLDTNSEQSRWLYEIGFYPTADPEIILKTDPVKHYFEAKALLEQLEEQKKELEENVRTWRALLQPMFERFPIIEENIRQAIRHVEEVEAALVKSQERGKVIQSKIDDTKQQLSAHNTTIQQNDETIANILAQTDSENEALFYAKVETNRRIEELRQKENLYQEQMAGFEQALAEVVNKQTLLESYHRLEHQVQVMKERLMPHHHERANLTVAINHLEQDGTYQALVQELENKKESVKALIAEWGRKRIAMELIYQTLRQGLDNPVPQMNDLANEIFETLSHGRYTQIKLNKTGIKVKQFSDILFEPHELSQGTLEQLYVALRLAFIENVRTMVKMPVIIDDAFVNFDEHRKESVYKVLSEMSERIQLLFFTFDSQALNTFEEKACINLDEFAHNSLEESV